MTILAIPLIIGAQFLSQPIMSFVAGQDFYASGAILQILIFAVAAIFLGTMFSHAVVALDKQKTMISFYVFTGFSSLLAYLYFIPRFSYFGAAGVTIYSETLIAVFSGYCVWKYSNFLPNLKTMIKSIISGLIMGVFLYFFAGSDQTTLGGLISTFVLASLIYFVILFLIGGIKSADIAAIIKRQNKNIGPTYGGSNL